MGCSGRRKYVFQSLTSGRYVPAIPGARLSTSINPSLAIHGKSFGPQEAALLVGCADRASPMPRTPAAPHAPDGDSGRDRRRDMHNVRHRLLSGFQRACETWMSNAKLTGTYLQRPLKTTQQTVPDRSHLTYAGYFSRYFSFSLTSVQSSASGSGSFFSVMLGHFSASSAFSSRNCNWSSGSSSSA